MRMRTATRKEALMGNWYEVPEIRDARLYIDSAGRPFLAWPTSQPNEWDCGMGPLDGAQPPEDLEIRHLVETRLVDGLQSQRQDQHVAAERYGNEELWRSEVVCSSDVELADWERFVRRVEELTRSEVHAEYRRRESWLDKPDLNDSQGGQRGQDRRLPGCGGDNLSDPNDDQGDERGD